MFREGDIVQLSETVKLYMTKEQKMLIAAAMTEYINTVNSLVSDAVKGASIFKYTSKDVEAKLPSALKNQCIRDAKSIVKKYEKARRAASNSAVPTLKKPCCYINNQNFKIKDNVIEFPVLIDGKSKRISVPIKLTKRQRNLFAESKLGTMRIVYKGRKIMAQVVYEVIEPGYSDEGNVMGIDLGIKCPAVSYCSDGSVKFYGNGRRNKYIRRHYAYLRKKLQKNKHISAVKRINNKEQRIMRDIDHKLSHDIVETAVAHNVKVIKLEQLQNIRSTTRTSRKNNHSLHTWSFYRLVQFIEYKARLAGIVVEHVNPAYTSQTCPVCGNVHHAKDRKYTCTCGFHIHRDLLGAINICRSTEFVDNKSTKFVGNRQTA